MDTATHNIRYRVVLANALERMRTGSTMRASKKTTTDRGISSSHMIKPGVNFIKVLHL